MQILLPPVVKYESEWHEYSGDFLDTLDNDAKIFETCRGQIQWGRQLESHSWGWRCLRWYDDGGAASGALFDSRQRPPEVRLGCCGGCSRTAIVGGTGAGILGGENLSRAVELNKKQEAQRFWKTLQDLMKVKVCRPGCSAHLWLVRKTSGRCLNSSDWAIWWLRLRVGSWKFLSVKRCTWLQCLVSSTFATLGQTKRETAVWGCSWSQGTEWGLDQEKKTKWKRKNKYSYWCLHPQILFNSHP